MRPFTRTIIELFDGKRRYLIPLYQRQYAWRVTPQLELLWEDLARSARTLQQVGALSAPHFMGAMVISQIQTFGKQVQAYEVIDGQQRLTTFQLLLTAFRDVAGAFESEYCDEVKKYLFNDGVMETPAVERFKLWPSITDRRAFLGIVSDIDASIELPDEDPDEQGVVRPSVAAYEFFKAKIHDFVFQEGQYDLFKMEKLFEAMRSGLAVVSIELESGDDAQTIFETLNSRGIPLTAGDLMRNFIFQRAKGMGQTLGSLNVDKLYEKYWLPLDGWFWKEAETRGRLTKSRLDWLLVDHLAMKRADLVSVEDLFDSYRRWILEDVPFGSIEDELKSITASASVHREIAERSHSSSLGKFGRFAHAFDVSTTMPLVLYLATEGGLVQDLGSSLSLIESFIVRRDICGLPTGNYNRLFVDVVARMRSGGEPNLQALAGALSASQADASRWPDDAEWGRAWMGRDQYKSNRQTRLKYILEAIEQRKRSAKDEVISIKSDLTVEHIMPQKWHEHWPVPGFDHIPTDEMNVDKLLRESERSAAVNKMGNLTLLTGKLNAGVSNGPFSIKIPALRSYSALALNRDLHDVEVWDEDAISRRGASLLDISKKIWASPPVDAYVPS